MLYLLSGMRVIKIFILFHLFFNGNLFCQSEKSDFKIVIPNKIPFSYYKYIRVLDMRNDTGNIGFVITKGLNNTALVVPEIPLQDQIQNLLYFAADSSLNGELILQIRKMKFVQRPTSVEGYGYFLFRANLFSKEKDYRKIASIDTFLTVSSRGDKSKLKAEASKIITDFILNNISKEPVTKSNLSYFEILHTDSIEKSSLTAYNIKEYQDGIYLNFTSFKNQVPDHKASKLIFSYNNLKRIKRIENGKKIKMGIYDVYAVIDKGKIYISSEYGFSTLYKFKGDFYFVGKGEVPYTNAEIAIYTVLYGATGAIMSSTHSKTAFFETWVDHVDGSFIRGRRLK